MSLNSMRMGRGPLRWPGIVFMLTLWGACYVPKREDLFGEWMISANAHWNSGHLLIAKDGTWKILDGGPTEGDRQGTFEMRGDSLVFNAAIGGEKAFLTLWTDQEHVHLDNRASHVVIQLERPRR